jgi:hypothetical protein
MTYAKIELRKLLYCTRREIHILEKLSCDSHTFANGYIILRRFTSASSYLYA